MSYLLWSIMSISSFVLIKNWIVCECTFLMNLKYIIIATYKIHIRYGDIWGDSFNM